MKRLRAPEHQTAAPAAAPDAPNPAAGAQENPQAPSEASTAPSSTWKQLDEHRSPCRGSSGRCHPATSWACSSRPSSRTARSYITMQRRGFRPPAIRHRGGTERLILLPLSHLRLDPTHLYISSKHANTDPAAHSINLSRLLKHFPANISFLLNHKAVWRASKALATLTFAQKKKKAVFYIH